MAANRFRNFSPEEARTALRLALAAAVAVGTVLGAEDPADPWLDRIEPLGGQVGTATEVLLVGRNLSAPAVLEFDSQHLSWESGEPDADGNLRGTVRVGPQAPPGPHIATLATPVGRSNSRLFYVDEFSSTSESEPNDTRAQAQAIELRPQTLHGAMHVLSDVDVFAFEARAGERWTFDLRSLEYGGFLENDMTVLDEDGHRVAFNDDRDEYLETPFLEHVFERSGRHFLKLDQYRGPQRVNCARNCGYMLRIGQLPIVEAAFPLGARLGSEVAVSLRGRSLNDIERVWLVPVRRAEYYRLTFPFTIPVRTDHQEGARIEGSIRDLRPDRAKVVFQIPPDARAGLWRLWVRSPGGIADTVSLEISAMPEPDCGEIRPASGGAACNGVLEHEGAEDEYWLVLGAGQPVVATTLATQLGLPRIDTVLELFDSDGTLVAEHDDLMSGQGTVIGNPDSMLVYRPETAGRYRLAVRDRIGRGGPDFAYRLRVEQREPGFALLTDPENLNVRAGSDEKVGLLLTPEPGFDRTVEIWTDGLPTGVSNSKGQFRAGQFFGPSGDGDNVVIPEIFLELSVSSELAPGDYPIRIFGRAEGRDEIVEAFSTLWIGPPRKRNDVRRPLESIRLTVLPAASSEPGATIVAPAASGAR